MRRDYTRTLLPYTLPKRPRRPFAAVVLLAPAPSWRAHVVYEDAPEETQVIESASALVSAFLSRHGSAYSWYVHEHERPRLLELVAPLTERVAASPSLAIDVIAQGTDHVIGFVVRAGHQRYELRDSAALLPVPLSWLAADFTEAAEHDTEPALRYLLALQGAYRLIRETFGVVPGWTVGATALKAWRATMQPEDYYLRQRPAVEDLCRRGYYGGYTFLSSTRLVRDAVTLDVNSMYPYVMRRYGVPAGVATYTERERGAAPAYYQARVEVPRTTLRPSVPYRDEHGVSWPTGSFETVLTSEEIAHARAHGTRVTVQYGYTFQRTVWPFERFVSACERIRLEAPGTARNRLAKLLQSSLYGKFGARPFVERYVLLGTPPADTTHWRPVINQDTGEIAPYLYCCIEPLKQSYLHPEWAGWITAQARLTLLRAVEVIGPGQVLYGDTDSLTVSRAAMERAVGAGAIQLGTAYGTFKLEREYSWFRAGSGKNYQGLLTDGRMLDKVAGIQREAVTSGDHTRAMDGETVTVESLRPPSTLSVIKGKGVEGSALERTYTHIRQSHQWQEDAGQEVRPRHVSGAGSAQDQQEEG